MTGHNGYEFHWQKIDWVILFIFVAMVFFFLGMVCGCQAVGTTNNTPIADGGKQVVNNGITYWDLYWSGLILLGIVGVLYYIREAIKYGFSPVRILKGIRK
jgi:hypothetical protein